MCMTLPSLEGSNVSLAQRSVEILVEIFLNGTIFSSFWETLH